jgi:hypothetical protein
MYSICKLTHQGRKYGQATRRSRSATGRDGLLVDERLVFGRHMGPWTQAVVRGPDVLRAYAPRAIS